MARSIPPIRVLVVDDHPLLRDGIAGVIEDQPDMEVAGEANDGIEAVEQFRRLRPDVTLMDLQMPGMNGIEAIMAIRGEFHTAAILVLTTYKKDVQAVRAIKAGARGYLLKSALRRDLIETIRKVHEGISVILPEIAAEIASHLIDESLTERETAVLNSVSLGNSNKLVSVHLKISEETVKAHMKSILDKLGARDRTHAVAIALRRGIISS